MDIRTFFTKTADKKGKRKADDDDDDDHRRSSSPTEKEGNMEPVRKRVKRAHDPGNSSRAVVASRIDVKELLQTPNASTLQSDEFEKHFDRIANCLLNECVLHINGIPHRLTEIEFYYHGHNHLDVHAHRDDTQKTSANWYFHKTGGNYRSGNYKGVDITFGDQEAYGGILVRGVEMLQHPFKVVDGPSLTVDHILSLTKQQSIPDFVQNHGISAVQDSQDPQTRPLYLSSSDVKLKQRKVLQSARVGLSLKKYQSQKEIYYGRRYRYFTLPQGIKKGKQYMIVALHQIGTAKIDIASIVGSQPKTVAKFVELFEDGKKRANWNHFKGKDLEPDDHCELLGATSHLAYPPATSTCAPSASTSTSPQ